MVHIKKHFEQLIWASALLFLFFMDPSVNTFSFCLFKFAGFDSCFGCGIGHAIHHALHFDFQESLNHHSLGIPATAFIIYMIFKPFSLLKTIKN